MNAEQKDVVDKNLEFAAKFLVEKKHKLLAKNHIASSSAGIDTRQIKGEFETMRGDRKFLVGFTFTINARPV
jgi:hypothetical protein